MYHREEIPTESQDLLGRGGEILQEADIVDGFKETVFSGYSRVVAHINSQ